MSVSEGSRKIFCAHCNKETDHECVTFIGLVCSSCWVMPSKKPNDFGAKTIENPAS